MESFLIAEKNVRKSSLLKLSMHGPRKRPVASRFHLIFILQGMDYRSNLNIKLECSKTR